MRRFFVSIGWRCWRTIVIDVIERVTNEDDTIIGSENRKNERSSRTLDKNKAETKLNEKIELVGPNLDRILFLEQGKGLENILRIFLRKTRPVS